MILQKISVIRTGTDVGMTEGKFKFLKHPARCLLHAGDNLL